MILIGLRPLIFVLIGLTLLYLFYRIAKKIIRTESIKEAIEEKKEDLDETIKFSKSLPKINKKVVKKAEKNIKDFLK